jgi:hypothetical protein
MGLFFYWIVPGGRDKREFSVREHVFKAQLKNLPSHKYLAFIKFGERAGTGSFKA